MPSQEPFSDTEVSFPPPQTFSIIPPIHALLLRLQAGTSTEANVSSSPAFDANPQQAQPLSIKDLASAAAPIRLKIAKARAVVDTLPDIDRTIEEQEEEIKALEARVKRLKGTLARVAHSHDDRNS